MSAVATFDPGLQELSLENASKRYLMFWYCQFRAGIWPKSFPYCKPAKWDSMSKEERDRLPAVIELKQITKSRVKSKDLCLMFFMCGFGGTEMSADEVIEYWERGGWMEWGTQMGG